MKIALISIPVLLLAGCSTIEDQIARGVNLYCVGTTPLEQALLRERIDIATAPHQVRVTCDGKDER